MHSTVRRVQEPLLRPAPAGDAVFPGVVRQPSVLLLRDGGAARRRGHHARRGRRRGNQRHRHHSSTDQLHQQHRHHCSLRQRGRSRVWRPRQRHRYRNASDLIVLRRACAGSSVAAATLRLCV